MIDVAELFAFCDLHVSRWRARRREVGIFGYLSGPQYYDRQGFPIPADPDVDLPTGDSGWIMPTLVWGRMMQDPNYRIVALDDLPDGSYLSTVWIGLDHSHGLSQPLIFETMRFRGDVSEGHWEMGGRVSTYTYHESLEFPDLFGEPGETTEQLRYATEEEAAAAHHEIVRRLRIREGH